jgi:uncharacterized coiled-coil DUF342 family protein
LTAELAEVRAKRDQLDAQNLRVTDNLRRTIEERDKAVAQLESLRAEYLAAAVAANTNSDKAAALREQLQQMMAERDAVKEANGSQFRMVQALQRDVSQLQVERDAVSEQLAQVKEAADTFQAENTYLQDTVRQLRAKQIHDDLPGILMVIQRAAQQARELI